MEQTQTLSTEQLLIHAIPILESYDKVLIGSVERDAIMSGQTDIFFQLGLTNPELMAAGQKEFLGLFSSMKNDMRNLIGEYIKDGALNNPVVARRLAGKYMKQFKSVCGRYYNEMFLSGAKAVGNPYYRDLGQTRKDFAFLAKARRVESRFFKRLLGDIGNPSHVPRHPYLRRATYYGESGRAQYLNGMVGGAGKQVNIKWMLNMYGTPLTEHCDVCPVLARGVYIWENLPTVPRGGDTPCMYRCYCGLQIKPAKGAPRITVPGRGTQEGQYSPNRYGKLYDAEGNLVMGTPLGEIETMYAEMYKARQMIQIKSGAERREWIMRRQSINRDLIDFIKTKGYRTVPTVSVRALIETAKSAQAKGGLLTTFGKLGIGDEVVFVRANYSGVGILEIRNNRLVFVGSDGQTLMVDDATDVLFVFERKWKPSGTLEEAKKWAKNSTYQEDLWHGTGVSSATAITKGGFRITEKSSGLIGTGVYLTRDLAYAKAYSKWRGGTRGAELQIKINVKNTLTDIDLFSKIQKKWSKKLGIDFMDAPEIMAKVTAELKRMGYDSVHIEMGGKIDEWCIFDPKHVMIVTRQ